MGLMHHHRRVRALRELAAQAPPDVAAISPLALTTEPAVGPAASAASRAVAESIAAQQQKQKAPQRH